MAKVRHLLHGIVRLNMRGTSPERFLNLCTLAGLNVWQVKKEQEYLLFYMEIRDFKRCAPLARKAGVRLHIVEKRGLPVFLWRNRKRKGWAVSFVLFFLLLLFLAQFVWEIDWSGNRRYTESELNHYLQTLQIEEGIPKKRISCARLEEELRESFEDITWVSVRLHGTRLFIRLRESEVPVCQEVESGEACDLAAVSDARITSVVVRSGIPLVQAGDTVEKGQLLVSGTVPITDDGGEEISSYRVRADADIYGIRERVGRKELPLWREMRTETGKKRYGIALEAGTHTFYWKIPEFYDMIEHTFDMADAFRQLPSVITDMEGAVTYRGSGNVGMLVDGVPYGLLEEYSGDVLIQLPALFFNQISLGAFPPINAVPDGDAGILNLVPRMYGTGDSPLYVTLGAGWNERYNAGAVLNLHPGKFHINAKYNYRREYRERSFSKSTATAKNRTEMNNNATARPDVHVADMKVDYDLSAKDRITVHGLYHLMEIADMQPGKLLAEHFRK